jgi:steroid delta-isomerase-like uncharacterized protein
MSETAKRIVERFYDEIWNRREEGAIERLCTIDLSFRGSLGIEKHGREELAEYVEMVTSALGEYHCAIDALVAEGDRAFAKMRFSGIHRGEFLGHPPTGRRVEWAGAALFTIAEGKIRELWVLGDVEGLRAQLRGDS